MEPEQVSPEQSSRDEMVRVLQQQVRKLEGTSCPTARSRVSSGCEALDRLLPARGFLRGTLVEWLGWGPGSGAATLALLAAREAIRDGGPLVVVDCQRTFYPPAAQRWGIDPAEIILVRPENDKDEPWILDQVLRCRQVAAVLSWPRHVDAKTFRRWQLAAERGECLGLLVRSHLFGSAPSWADVRWQVRGLASQSGWRLSAELLRLRGGPSEGRVELEIDESTGTVHETHPLPLAVKLADPAPRCRQARA